MIFGGKRGRARMLRSTHAEAGFLPRPGRMNDGNNEVFQCASRDSGTRKHLRGKTLR